MKTIITELPERDDFCAGNYTIEIGYPWITTGSIMALELILTPEFKVFEFGSGGSTIFFSRRCKSVKTLESQISWAEKLKTRSESFPNITLFCEQQQRHLEIINGEPDNFYDLILIDCDPNNVERILMANASIRKIKKDGWLVIDNYGAFGMENFNYTNFEIYSYDDFLWVGKGTRLCKKLV